MNDIMKKMGKRIAVLLFINAMLLVITAQGTMQLSAAGKRTENSNEQEVFAFEKTFYELYYGAEKIKLNIMEGISDSEVTFEIVEGVEIAKIDENTGELTFFDGRAGVITVKAIRASDKTECLTTVTNTKRIDASSEYMVKGIQGKNGWYTDKIELTANDGYQISTLDGFYNWKDCLEITKEGITEPFTIYLRETKTGAISKAISTTEYKIDKSMPEKLRISYSQSVLDMIAEKLHFYKETMTVTIEAEDAVSGIDHFSYSCMAEKDQEPDNIEIHKEDIIFEEKDGRLTGKAMARFRIEPQFKGSISFSAEDSSGRVSTYADTEVIVADNKKPYIYVDYEKQAEAVNGNCYSSSRTAMIRIEEANFFSEEAVVTVKQRLNNEEEYTETIYTGENGLAFEPCIGEEGDAVKDTYCAKLYFTEEADYILEVSYTDRSGNIAEAYHEEFVIDKTAPIVEMTYDNNCSKNSDQFKENRTATIKIVEHNFDPSDIEIRVAAKDKFENNVEIINYASYLRDRNHWESRGDVHTVSIRFDAEANYVIEKLEYKDMAGNISKGVDYKDSAAPVKFTIDKTAPRAEIQIGEWTNSVDGSRWDHFITNGSFALWENKELKVTVKYEDELSGIELIEHFRSSEFLTIDEVRESKSWILADGDGKAFSYEAAPQACFIVYVHIVDRAGNESYVSSDGVILDAAAPFVEKASPEVTVTPSIQPVNGIYHTDVKIDVKVLDPIVQGVCSGLQSITYEVYNNSLSSKKPTQTGKLFEFDKTAPQKDEFVQSFEKNACIIVDRKRNNSNDVVVKIAATDNAGNVTMKSCNLMIDITAPEIDISYSNNEADHDLFFKEDRIAEIIITERNFNADDVKIRISNTAGAVPKISEWKRYGTHENQDDTKWIATIAYDEDGDYTFDIDYSDLAGNPCPGEKYAQGTTAAKAFTIDKTIPEIEVVYDDQEGLNGNYYKNTRTATLIITEHNFDENCVEIMMTALDDGMEIGLPKISYWSSNGDRNTATIIYDTDAFYTFDIDVKDKAGNEAADFEKAEFYIDKTAPFLKITGVENASANNKEVIPIITCSDTNYDPEQVSITLTGAKYGKINTAASREEIRNGQIFTFENFAEKKETDDIYTLTAQLTDKAGNTSKETICFSVNRFGSNYELSTSLKELVGTYVKEARVVEFSEINVNKLEKIQLTVFKNSETIVLEEGKDYKINLTGGNGQWYRYTYHIFEDNFAEDAVYRITVYSEDAAGNISENTLDTKNSEIRFGVDSTAPLLVISNLQSDQTYASEHLQVFMMASDNLLLSSVEVYLDDYDNPYKIWNHKEISDLLEANEALEFEICGDSTEEHRLKAVCMDEAGNITVQEVTGFYVTTNLWIRFYTNKPLLYAAISGTATVLTMLGCRLSKRKRKEDASQEKTS